MEDIALSHVEQGTCFSCTRANNAVSQYLRDEAGRLVREAVPIKEQRRLRERISKEAKEGKVKVVQRPRLNPDYQLVVKRLASLVDQPVDLGHATVIFKGACSQCKAVLTRMVGKEEAKKLVDSGVNAFWGNCMRCASQVNQDNHVSRVSLDAEGKPIMENVQVKRRVHRKRKVRNPAWKAQVRDFTVKQLRQLKNGAVAYVGNCNSCQHEVFKIASPFVRKAPGQQN